MWHSLGSLTQLRSVGGWVGLEGPGKLQSFVCASVHSAWPLSLRGIFPYSVVWPELLYMAADSQESKDGRLQDS